MKENGEIAQSLLAQSRAKVYGLLASVFSKPPDDADLAVFVGWLRNGSGIPLETLPEQMRTGLDKVRIWLEEYSNQCAEGRPSELASEFIRLFRGLRRGPSPPPPYESVYVDEGILYGPSTDMVNRKYQQYNLRIETKEPPDHIALELDFMRFLCESEAAAYEAGQDVQRWLREQNEFLREHLLPWVPSFCVAIQESSHFSFFDGIADLTEGWINCDLEITSGLQAA